MAVLFGLLLFACACYALFRWYQQTQKSEQGGYDSFAGSQQGYLPPVQAGVQLRRAPPRNSVESRKNQPMMMTQKYETLHKTEDQVIESLISTLDQQHLLINFGDLRIEDEVGRGVSSIVYCGKYNRGKGAKEETVAIKILHEKVIATEQAVDIFKEFFEREIAVLCKIEHENVLNLYGLAAHRGCLHIVTDYYPLTLDLLCRGTGGKPGSGSELIVWSEEMIQSLAVQLAKGMEHLHAQNIVHRDLKPANCLITANGSKLVLADFGLSKVLNEHYCSMTGQIGSPAFMANEMINDSLSNKNLDYQMCDVFSFGVVLNSMWGQELPYAGMGLNPLQLLLKVSNGLRPKIQGTCPPKLAALINRCWNRLPSQRPSFSSIVYELQRPEIWKNVFDEY